MGETPIPGPEVVEGLLRATRPDAFLPNLAASLASLGKRLAELDRHDEASKASGEALEILWPIFQKYPQRFAQWTGMMLSDNVKRLRGAEPSALLAERISQFQALVDAESDSPPPETDDESQGD